MGSKKYLYKSPDEIISILSERGLIFSQAIRAKRLIRENGYFALKSTSEIFLTDKLTFRKGIDFEHLYLMYLFDKDFKILLLRQILEIEAKIKAAIGDVISTRYGTEERQYLDRLNFNQTNQHIDEVLKKIKRQTKKYRKKHPDISRHIKHHNGCVPFWILSKCLTMGVIRDLFNILKPNDQDEVAKIVMANVDIDKPVRKLKSMIALLVDIRNMCAHDDKVIGYVHHRIDIGVFPEQRLLKLKHNVQGDLLQGRKDMMAVLISIKYLVNKTSYRAFLISIASLISRLSSKLPGIKCPEIVKFIGLSNDYIKLISI
ncbi:MAG: Abi family protein [Bacilli bacterium]|jgi:abortive infection bacteriophage resistance protein